MDDPLFKPGPRVEPRVRTGEMELGPADGLLEAEFSEVTENAVELVLKANGYDLTSRSAQRAKERLLRIPFPTEFSVLVRRGSTALERLMRACLPPVLVRNHQGEWRGFEELVLIWAYSGEKVIEIHFGEER